MAEGTFADFIERERARLHGEHWAFLEHRTMAEIGQGGEPGWSCCVVVGAGRDRTTCLRRVTTVLYR